MPLLNLSHETTYTYRQAVGFGEHRLMLRPRESHDQHLVSMALEIDPEPAEVRWLQDVFGNSVAIARFDRRATRLRIASRVRVDHRPGEVAPVHLEDYARTYPFTYAADEMPDLLRSVERQHPDPERAVDAWARRFVRGGRDTDTLAMLAEITAAIRHDFTYVPRWEAGTQTPAETLARRQGTCRDYAVLMIEAVRALGLAARVVSGYVYSPRGVRAGEPGGRVGGGNTHAWARVFLPGSGWVEFDPTNGIVGNDGLIRVAVARDLCQAVPVAGTFSGFPGSFLDMAVRVDITADAAEPVQPAPAQPAPVPLSARL